MKTYDSYKDSGVEWIGEIPSYWHFYNLKFILREGVKDGPHETPVWCEDGIPFLSIDGILN
jgi:type I restriction enzyme S subunit